jgi:elongation factor Ts
MAVTAAMVKELRERTGSGMMDCKRALEEAGGDMEAAIEAMRKSGIAKAAKKAGRIAAEGVVVCRTSADGRRALLMEINCETDFVARDVNFLGFAEAAAETALGAGSGDMDGLAGAALAGGAGQSVEEARQQLVAKLGENISVRRFESVVANGGTLGHYVHGSRIGVIVRLEGGDAELGRDIAMHVAASRPLCVSEQELPAETLAQEREIFAAQAAESGKPPEIVEKMVQGRVARFIKEVTLLGQPYVKDPDQSVEKLLKARGAAVTGFLRFEVGEGIEKKSDDFASEVMAQARGS